MNKLLVDKENVLVLKDETVQLDILVEELTLEIIGNVVVYDVWNCDKKKIDLKIVMNGGSSLIYNGFYSVHNLEEIVDIHQSVDSKVNFNVSLLSLDTSSLVINHAISGDNNFSSICVRSVTEEQGEVVVNGTVVGEMGTINNQILEKINMLVLNDGMNQCVPNLVVKSNEIVVNHAATISGINEMNLFYFMSKGIEINSARQLVRNGFLLGNLELEDELLEECKKLI